MTLMNESQCTYRCTVGMEFLNGSGYLKPSGYQTLVMDVAARHLRQFQLGVDDLLPRGMSWVLISSSVEILSPVREELTLTARTWHSEQDRLTFRRELCFTGADGTPLFNASTFSVLMDLKERRILRPDTLGFEIGQPHSEFVIDASPRLRFRGEMQPCDRRKVYNSCIDRLGHTNNCRYPEFAYDALTEGEIASLGSLRRMDVFFRSELRPGEWFTVRRSAPEIQHGELFVDGINDQTGKQAFVCRFEFA